jgi:hypothetical protein
MRGVLNGCKSAIELNARGGRAASSEHDQQEERHGNGRGDEQQDERVTEHPHMLKTPVATCGFRRRSWLPGRTDPSMSTAVAGGG